MNKTSTIVLALGTVLMVTACGGSSGSSKPRYDLNAAFAALYEQGEMAALQASGACSGTLVQVRTPAAEASGEAGGWAASLTRTSLLMPGCDYPSRVVDDTIRYSAGLTPVAREGDSGAGTIEASALPSNARVGDSGVYAVVTLAGGHEEVRYALEADDGSVAGAAIVALETHRVGPGNTQLPRLEHRYRIGSDGSLTLLSFAEGDMRFTR